MAEKPKAATKSAAPSVGEPVLDFSEVRPFEPLPDRDPESGKTLYYLTRVTKMTPGKGPKGEKRSVELTVVKPEEHAKRKLFREFSLVPAALPFLYGFFKALNPQVELGANFRLRDSDWLGLECAITIENREYQEQIRSAPKNFYPASAYVEE